MLSLRRAARGFLSVVVLWGLLLWAWRPFDVSGRAPEASQGLMAFVASRGENWELYVMSDSGKNLRQLTKTPVDERSPALSPDRKTVVYSTSNGELWTLNLAAERPERLPLPKGVYNSPRWSPDGQEIVFVAYQASAESEDSDILTYNVKTKQVKTVIHQTGMQMYPTYAGSPLRILYSTALVGPHAQVIQQLWLYDRQQSRARQLLLSNANDIQPDYSPRSQRIAFASNREGKYDLWTADLQGAGLARVTADAFANTSPCWSPDGSRLLYVSNRGGAQELWTIRPDGTDAQKLSPFGAESVAVKDPDWK